jgi:hypothetical protein
MILDGNAGNEAILAWSLDVDAATPGQKARIIFHPINQLEHLFCAIPNKDRFVHDSHQQ